jgi:transposase
MSLLPQIVYEVPEETARVARAAFPKGNPYLRLADQLGVIYQDGDFAQLFPFTGQPALAPVRLALTTILQFAEGLSDRQAADAVRGRMDWKYLLCLELTDPGFDASVLCEFRARLLAGEAEELLLTKLLTLCQEVGWLKARGRQRTDSTHVLAAVRVLNRLERVGETLRAALNEVAAVAPDWLRARAPVEWYERYGRRIENYHLPKSEAAREDYAAQVGQDGQALLNWLAAPDTAPHLLPLVRVQTLRQIWAEQFTTTTRGLRLRPVKEMPAVAALMASPYDVDARWSTKRDFEWVGYKVHLTETCEPEQPHLITEVTTTPATTPDDNMLAEIHEKLAARDLLPAEHLVDKGYTSADVLVAAQEDYGVKIVGPVAADPSWQARTATGFAKAQFQVDWERKVVTCPAGKESRAWSKNSYQGNGIIWEARFAKADCTPCPSRAQCTQAKVEPRLIGLQERPQQEALQRRRAEQTTPEFRAAYAARAGIEGTHSQGVRRCDLRQARYLGLLKTHLQQILTAVALNLLRIAEWLVEAPLAKTRVSAFAALKPAPA